MSQSILLVEDDDILRDALAYRLQEEGYEVREARDGDAALSEARRLPPDLVVLDVMLPRLDGLSVCRILRAESETPIILLTARAGEVDKIIGLESGADDYVTKPFSTGELLARIRAVMRRTVSTQGTLQLEHDDLRLNIERRRAYLGEKELVLSPKEFDLLAELMRHSGMTLSRDLLLDRVWGYDFSGDTRTVDVHIHWLRDKIEVHPSRPKRIHTVRGVGYRFEG
ncbi:MAG: response regulator transcription factor [Anaerolineales bacterium]|nr:response regulator transcription factor [Anaerolineales bacterium]MCB9128030.1 response regulator transcription factor [Ardenticatenales bacterium]MCB9172046.1 response regulator transcription factor [Ardenticatenales bacterium]